MPIKLNPLADENEKYCAQCEGTGILLVHTAVGSEADFSSKSLIKQSRMICPDCTDGVQQLCPRCKAPKKKGEAFCPCHTLDMYDTKSTLCATLHEDERKERILFEDIKDSLGAIYIYELDEIVRVHELDSWMEMLQQADKDFDINLFTVYVTYTIAPELSAKSLLNHWLREEQANGLYHISSEAVDELEQALTNWQRDHELEITKILIDFSRQIIFGEDIEEQEQATRN